jgi:protein TonB
MVPSTHLLAPPEPEVEETNPIAALVLEPPEKPTVPPRTPRIPPTPIQGDLFKSSLVENNRIKSSSRTVDLLIAFAVHFVVLSIPILAGLYFTDTLNLKEFQSTFLVAPPPPPAPPPAPAVVVVKAPTARRVFENAGKLIAPTVIPKNIAEIKEAPLPPEMDSSGGVPGGVPGGVAGGSMGGVIGGVLGGLSSTTVAAPLAPKENRPKAPVRVGGRVREPKLILKIDPTYPPLARQTHMEGVVVIDAVLDEQGNVVEAKVTSGPPLLIQAALDAVRKWRYEPTYLNDQPVAVQLNVTVSFRLSQ